MKERIDHQVVNRKLLVLLFSIFFVGLGYNTRAQGWTFTFQLAESGPCGGGPIPVLPTFPNFGLPTQNQCESMRQLILNISASTAIYDNQGHYIGDCKVYYTCTACTGSDIITPGQANPGDVSFDGASEGKPFFTTHQSEAFEDWARDYKALLESYGITSILGNTLISHLMPLTGDKNFDKFYESQSAGFNPPADSGVYSSDSHGVNSTDDLLNKSPVLMGGSPMTTEEVQRQVLFQDIADLEKEKMDKETLALLFDDEDDNELLQQLELDKEIEDLNIDLVVHPTPTYMANPLQAPDVKDLYLLFDDETPVENYMINKKGEKKLLDEIWGQGRTANDWFVDEQLKQYHNDEIKQQYKH